MKKHLHCGNGHGIPFRAGQKLMSNYECMKISLWKGFKLKASGLWVSID